MPPAAAELCQILPPPECFNGPFVVTERLCEIFNKVHLPDEFHGEFQFQCLFTLAILRPLGARAWD